jgi:hypothetical protein
MVNGFELFKGSLEADAQIKKKPRRVDVSRGFSLVRLALGQLPMLAVGLLHYHDDTSRLDL